MVVKSDMEDSAYTPGEKVYGNPGSGEVVMVTD